MSRCRDVAMSRCRDVAMSRCRDVAMSRCRDVAMSRCRDVAMLRCCHALIKISPWRRSITIASGSERDGHYRQSFMGVFRIVHGGGGGGGGVGGWGGGGVRGGVNIFINDAKNAVECLIPVSGCANYIIPLPTVAL